MLFIDNRAAKELWTFVGMGRRDYPLNQVEQGGLFAGFRLSETSAVVTHFVPADDYVVQTRNYVEWSGLEDIVMRRKFRAIQNKLAQTNPSMADRFQILGWFHTHTFSTPVFMSGTDRATQEEKYSDNFALVANPHTMILKAYWGACCKEIPVLMAVPVPEEAKHVRHKRGKKRKNQYGLPRGGKKKRKGRR